MDGLALDLQSARRRITAGLIAAVAVFMFVQYFRTPQWGQALRGEWNLWTVAEAMMDFLTAMLAFTCALLGRYIVTRRVTTDRTWTAWLLISFGFLYFTLDETLEFHERMGRALYYTPLISYLKDFQLRPHNVVEATYYFVAFILMLRIYKRLRQNPALFTYFMGGIGFMAFQTLLGLIPKHIGNDRLPFMFPELLEMSALTCFACAFISLLFEQVSAIYRWATTGQVLDAVPAEQVSPHVSVGN